MKIYTTILTLFIFVLNGHAQGYEQWKASEDLSTHLQAPYKIKKAYFSPTGKSSDFYLKQYQEYNTKGRMTKDVLHKNRLDQLYDIRINYRDSTTARSFNQLDSSTAIYKFSKTGKITYYLTEDKVGLFINYQYDSLDRLSSCKDCMAPFGNATQCAYYEYTYENELLTKIKQYSVSKVQLSKAGQFYAVDSLVYQNSLLSQKYFIDLSNHQARHKNIYTYNKKQQCISLLEYRKRDENGEASETWKTSYKYHCNGQLKKTVTELFLARNPVATKVTQTSYNSKGHKKKSIIVDNNNSKKRYRFEYK